MNQETRALFLLVQMATEAGMAKANGTLAGEEEWEFGKDDMSRVVLASPLFDLHPAALVTFVNAVHMAAYALAEDVEGARMAGRIERNGH